MASKKKSLRKRRTKKRSYRGSPKSYRRLGKKLRFELLVKSLPGGKRLGIRSPLKKK